MLSNELIVELYSKGTNYLRCLAVSEDNREEALSRSFVKLLVVLQGHEEDKHEEVALNIFKKLVHQGACDDWKQRKRSKVPVEGVPFEDIARLYEEQDTEIKLIHAIFNFLSEDDIIVILALIDSGFSMTETAIYLGYPRNYMYQKVGAIQNRLRKLVPGFGRESKPSPVKQVYKRKYADWGRFLSVVEVVDYVTESEDSGYEKSIIAGSCSKPRNRIPSGTNPTSTPAIQTISLKEYNSDMS